MKIYAIAVNDRVPIIDISRHRLGIDGEGITTLVVFHGCELCCRYCINPQTLQTNETKAVMYTVDELYERIRVDSLYFMATNGGVTFGGGEPLLNFRFIKDFKKICDANWRIYVETSLNVPVGNVKSLLGVVDEWIVDVKSLNDDIYKKYTGKVNTRMFENLDFLCDNNKQDSVLIRLPLIPGYNTEDDRCKSRERLELMGFKRFDLFNYIK